MTHFQHYLQQSGYGKSSQSSLLRCIQEFLEIILKNPVHATAKDVLHFYQYLQQRPSKRTAGGLSEVFIHHYMYSLRVFFNWLEQTGQITENPMSNLRFKKPHYNRREPLSQSEVAQLFVACCSAKEIALLHLFYSCGLRRTEAERLNTEDVHFAQKVLYVRKGKGAKRRAIPIKKSICEALQSYLLYEKPFTAEKAFMLNNKQNRMSGNSYNALLKNIVERSGIEKNISLHHLRHSIATHLLENGLHIELVRDFLGHTHLESTQIYTKVSTAQVSQVLHEHL